MQIRNSITLIGNVGQQPEVFFTKAGEEFLRFSLATNESYRDKSGNRVTRTEWHTIMVFGAKAGVLKENLSKGNLLAVQGQLRYNKWTDKHEQSRISATIHLNDFTYLSPKEKEATSVAA